MPVTIKKKWYLSKTMWVNAIAAVALGLQSAFGFEVSPEYQAYALVAINLVLRWITKEELV
jgi:uncharacterized protein involved in exopolysaccharide biosynthesis